jgi:hypothetical protein
LLPGSGGFQPELSLVYSTWNGNGLFGLGWNLSVPGVSRKTSKGVPRYGAEEVEEMVSDFRVVTFPVDFTEVRASLRAAGVDYENAEITMLRQNSIDLDVGTAKQTLRLIDALEENDDGERRRARVLRQLRHLRRGDVGCV